MQLKHYLVSGFELCTSRVLCRCATNWAIQAWISFKCLFVFIFHGRCSISSLFFRDKLSCIEWQSICTWYLLVELNGTSATLLCFFLNAIVSLSDNSVHFKMADSDASPLASRLRTGIPDWSEVNQIYISLMLQGAVLKEMSYCTSFKKSFYRKQAFIKVVSYIKSKHERISV